MKIVIVAARVPRIAAEWVKAGHEVSVVTGFEPDQRVGLLRKDADKGVRVIRTYAYAAPGALGRALTKLSGAATAVALAPTAAEVRGADVVVAMAPPWTSAGVGWALARLLRARFVVDLRARGPAEAVASSFRRHELVILRSADLVVTADPPTARRVGVVDTTVIEHGFDVQAVVPWPPDSKLRAELRIGDAFVVGYVGRLGPTDGVDRILDAAAVAKNLHFLIVGDGPSRARLIERATDEGLSHVTFVPAPDLSSRPRFVAAADLHIVTSAVQLVEIMAAARPVVFVGDGEGAERVEEAGAGWVASPGRPRQLAAAIKEASADPAGTGARGEVARIFVEENFDDERIAARYLETITDLAR